MKYLLALLLSLPLFSLGQSETHNFVTYDTTIAIFTAPFGPTNTWHLRISRPVNYFTPNHPDTASRPAIITMPGQGEMGPSTTFAMLQSYGPHYWLNNGWDGSVVLGNGTHYPLLITVIYVNAVFTDARDVSNIVDTIIKVFHPKQGGRHFAGLSQGSFTWGAQVMYEKTALAETGMKRMTTLTALQGEPNATVTPSWDRGILCYKIWNKKYGGRYFTLEGNGSDNFRNTWKYADAMNDTVPNTGYFSYEGLGGGAHCCWNSMYDPNQHNWNCVTPPAFGPNNTASQLGTNQMGSYKIGSNLFQWMLRNGDSSLVGTTPCSPVVSAGAGADQVITLPANNATTTASASASCGNTITSTLWTQVSGPSTAGISAPSSLTTSFTSLIQGTYQFKFTATDNTSSTAFDLVNVTVNPVSACRIFFWPTTSGNINITNATVVPVGQPPLRGCDIIYIDLKVGGYRSFSMSNIGSMADSQDILIKFINGAYITPTTGSIQANQMDSINHVRVFGLNMSNNVDPIFFRYATLAHSHFLTFDSLICKNSPGMFPSSMPSMASVPAFTGWMYDTVNIFYKIRWHNCVFDSTLYTSLTALWLCGAPPSGPPPANQIWLCTEIDSCVFKNYMSSTPGPSTFINLTNCFGTKVHHNKFSKLGLVVNPTGHAGLMFTKYSQNYVYCNEYGPEIFGNEYRSAGGGEIRQFRWLLTRENPLYDGTSWFCWNYIHHKRKYPAVEAGVNFVDSINTFWYIPRRSIRVFNNTFFRPAVGQGNNPYRNSLFDAYGGSLDTVEVKNNIEIGPNMDTTLWVFNTSTSGSGTLITFTNGLVKKVDTSNNIIVGSWPANGYVDSVIFRPVLNGGLYNQGVKSTLPIGVVGMSDADFYGNPVPTLGRGPIGQGAGIDIGAFQLLEQLIINSLYFPIHTIIVGP